MYKSALFHLHSLFEGNSSAISGFCHEARRYGIDVVWVSDHDSRYFREKSYQLDLHGEYQLHTPNGPDAFRVQKVNGGSLLLHSLATDEDWSGVALDLPYLSKTHRPPLLARPTLKLEYQSDIRPHEEDRRLLFRFHLSQVPPEHRPLVVSYYLGPVPDGDTNLALSGGSEGGEIRLADDLQKLGFGMDHNLNGIEFGVETRNGAEADVELKSVGLETALWKDDELLAAQRELAAELGREYGVQVHVNCEVSSQNGHMTIFSPDTPIPKKEGGKLSGQELNRFLEQWGGVASINHPFSSWKREDLDPEGQEGLITRRVEEYTTHGLYGARMLEIAFPEGRHNFTAAQYAQLWDRLNVNGLRVVGIGVSDAHSNRSWDRGNNFANYMRSPDCSAQNLVAALRRGDIYSADPTRVGGELHFETDQGKSMGDTQHGGDVLFEIRDIPHGSRLSWVADGRYVQEEITSDHHRSLFALDEAEHFVRAELCDTYGRLLLLTNPIWTG